MVPDSVNGRYRRYPDIAVGCANDRRAMPQHPVQCVAHFLPAILNANF